MVFMYWLKNIETGEEAHHLDEMFHDIGTVIELNEKQYKVVDYAVEQSISCEENKLQKEDLEFLY